MAFDPVCFVLTPVDHPEVIVTDFHVAGEDGLASSGGQGEAKAGRTDARCGEGTGERSHHTQSVVWTPGTSLPLRQHSASGLRIGTPQKGWRAKAVRAGSLFLVAGWVLS